MAVATEKKTSKKLSLIRKKAAPTPALTANEVRHMVEEAAYYRAQARGFNGDQALDDWLAAEEQISSKAVPPVR